MALVSEQLIQKYRVRREVSHPADLAVLLLARLRYSPAARQSPAVSQLLLNLPRGTISGLEGQRAAQFAKWLYEYLTITRTIRGVSHYPIHPVLTIPVNGEHVRVEMFIDDVVACFTLEERSQLIEKLWARDSLPGFEQAVYDLIDWQITAVDLPPTAEPEHFAGNGAGQSSLSATGILALAKEDLCHLADVTVGIQDYVTHAGRLLAFALSRYLLAQAGVDFRIPIYSAPAADSHEAVKTLANGIIELHRAQFGQRLREQFLSLLEDAMAEQNIHENPSSESQARQLVKDLFHYNANVVPLGQYENLLLEHGNFAEIAYDYYWRQSEARNRFMRQLHATHLNLAKKVGVASARSRYSQWHFYWLAPALIETLVLTSQPRLRRDRILMVELFDEWRKRYGIAVLIDPSWEHEYGQLFRSLGNPETLNEANRRRFVEILAERGRLSKNSDDFPWVVLKD